MLLTKENIKANVPNICGIYLIRNMVNNKCYIGQSIYLQKRLLKHITPNTWKYQKDRMLIYKAFEKYGLEAFEFEILEVIDSLDYSAVKPKLDSLEKNYILQYNSKKDGYNQTDGGDAGVTGFKMSDCQKQHQRTTRIKAIKEWQNEIRCFNVNTLQMTFATSIREMGEKLGIKLTPGSLRNLIIAGLYIIARNGSELNEKSKQYYTKRTQGNISNLGRFKEKLDIQKFILYRKSHSITECAKHFNVTCKTCYNYQNKYCPEMKGIRKF